MKIPKQIKIAGFNYTVERKDAPFVSADGSALDGQHRYADKTIVVAHSGCKEYQDVVFLHEMIHAIIENYVSPMEHDELFVEQLSKGLYQVLVDNPSIFSEGKEITDV